MPELSFAFLTTPEGWTARVRGGDEVTVPAYGSADVLVDLRVATQPSSGSQALDVAVYRDFAADTSMATTRTPSSSTPRASPPTLRKRPVL